MWWVMIVTKEGNAPGGTLLSGKMGNRGRSPAIQRGMTTPKSIPKRRPSNSGSRQTSAKNPLVTSAAQAEQEKTGLRRERERLETDPRVADTNIRSSLT